MKETVVADVTKFTQIAGCTTDQFNVRQTALYIGLQLEEMAEKLEEIFGECSPSAESVQTAHARSKGARRKLETAAFAADF